LQPGKKLGRGKKIFFNLLTRLAKNEKPTVAEIGGKGGTYNNKKISQLNKPE